MNPSVNDGEVLPQALLAPRMNSPLGWEGPSLRKAWDYRITAAIPHFETPELLPAVIELLRLQTERPYLLVLDTGSCEATVRQLEALRAEDVEIHYVRAHSYRRPSDPVAVAMDLAMALCRTEYLFCTHADCFLRRQDFLEWMISLCSGSKSQVPGSREEPYGERIATSLRGRLPQARGECVDGRMGGEGLRNDGDAGECGRLPQARRDGSKFQVPGPRGEPGGGITAASSQERLPQARENGCENSGVGEGVRNYFVPEPSSSECGFSPVVGYQMSPRDWITDQWKGMVGHTATMLHMPTMHRIGATWSLRRAELWERQATAKDGWPDTETSLNLVLREAGIKPLLIGNETNFERFVDENIDHCRSYTSSRLYDKNYHREAVSWSSDALREAEERIALWRSPASICQLRQQKLRQAAETYRRDWGRSVGGPAKEIREALLPYVRRRSLFDCACGTCPSEAERLAALGGEG